MASCSTLCIVFLRLFQMICLIVIFSLVAFPNMKCGDYFKTATDVKNNVTSQKFQLVDCKTMDSPLSIGHWNDGVPAGFERLKGQYFVFISAIIFAVISLSLILAGCCSCLANKHAIATICGFGALIIFVAGIVEAWYAAGFGMLPAAVDMWIAASVLCFVVSLLYIIDITLALKSEDE